MSKGLEALEKLRQNNIDNSHLFDNELLDIVEKELKALEIIKNLDSCIKFRVEKGSSDYFLIIEEWVLDNNVNEIKVAITEEEYELLKEVLK